MTPRELLVAGARELGIQLTLEQVSLLFRFVAEVEKWNRKINLTAIKNQQEIVIKHLLDSLSFTLAFAPRAGLRLLDLGSGAGFPALVIKIAIPEIRIAMVESTAKKASFLRHVIRTLKLAEADVIGQRTDQLPDEHRSTYDVVTARAFAEMTSAVPAAVPFLRKTGLLVLSRGPGEHIAEDELKKSGALLEKKLELTLPFSDYRRAIWVFRRAG